MKSMFKKYFLCMTLMLVAGGMQLFASGIQVQGTTVTTNADKKSAQIKFTLTWDHSWRLATTDAPGNWDAAWVYVKFRTIPGDNWYHAYVSTAMTNHVVPSNAEMKVATSPAIIGGVSANTGIGAFIYRKAAGNGTITFQDIELNWAFTQNGLSGGEQVEVCVLATEMVYIPQGAFRLGDDNTSSNTFRRQPAAFGNIAYPVTSAAIPAYVSNSPYNNVNYPPTQAIQSAGVAAGGTADDFPTASATSAATALPAAYPNGFNAFYCMKYEITQGEYLQFLNKNLISVKNAKTYLPIPVGDSARFAIQQRSGTGVGTIPAEFELTNPMSAFLPCNWLGTKDILAWLVWAGLRPMTEFEFEKVCRGPEPIPTTASLKPQYAWGSVDINNTVGFVNKGMNNEGPSNSEANSNFATTAGTNPYMNGPMRGGGYATPVSSRAKAGASYYGVMEMSGNLRERCVTVGNANGRAYTGIHGNGEIGNGTNPNMPANWPSLTAAGLGFRGGSYLDVKERSRISDRQDINTNDVGRKANYGGRGVRTAP